MHVNQHFQCGRFLFEAVSGSDFCLMEPVPFPPLCACRRFACGPRHPRRCCQACPRGHHTSQCEDRQWMWRWLRSPDGSRNFRCQQLDCDRLACGPRHRNCCRNCPHDGSHTFPCVVRQENMQWITFCLLVRSGALQLWCWWFSELFRFSIMELL